MGRLGAALVFVAACAGVARAEEERGHCTALGFGRKATSTGSTMLAHTDDRCVGGRWERTDAGFDPAGPVTLN